MTGDRDMYQCAGERVSVLYLKSGKVGFEEVDPAEVRKRYGISPELVPDFIALRGDPVRRAARSAGDRAEDGGRAAASSTARSRRRSAGADGERPRTAAALREQADELRAFADIATLRTADVERPADRETDLKRRRGRARGWTAPDGVASPSGLENAARACAETSRTGRRSRA